MTHSVTTAEEAWRIVEWYKRRWLIEQLLRILKTKGFKLEDSQIGNAERLHKLVAMATNAAVITFQLVLASDGRDQQPVRIAFGAEQVAKLAAFNRNLEAESKRLRNPHPPDSLAWAAWIIGRLARLGRLPIVQAAGPHHHEARPRILARRRSRMEPQKCVDALGPSPGRR